MHHFYRDQYDFVGEMHNGGIGAMELVAMHMKGTGQYLARSLSFKDASFEIVEVKLTGMICVQKSGGSRNNL